MIWTSGFRHGLQASGMGLWHTHLALLTTKCDDTCCDWLSFRITSQSRRLGAGVATGQMQIISRHSVFTVRLPPALTHAHVRSRKVYSSNQKPLLILTPHVHVKSRRGCTEVPPHSVCVCSSLRHAFHVGCEPKSLKYLSCCSPAFE